MDVDLPNVLKRCLSAPFIIDNNLTTISSSSSIVSTVISKINTRRFSSSGTMASSTTGTTVAGATTNPSSREASPAPVFNIFAPRARRYSASFASISNGNGTGPRLTPRVSQLRQEECLDMNSREMNHEREIHSALQISQSWEDLTLVTENWSCKSDDLTNPLQVTLPTGPSSCSSPSPTSRGGVRLPYGLSPSPTRRTFATRRSMSPIAMRPSQLGPVKRKFELEDNSSNWSTCSPPPLKKIFTESRGPSPVCQSPSCPSPDSGTYEGRITPKLFSISKLCSNSNTNTNTNSSSSMCSSPSMVPSPLMDTGIDLQTNISSSLSSPVSSTVPSIVSMSSSSSSSTCSSSSQEAINIALFERELMNDVMMSVSISKESEMSSNVMKIDEPNKLKNVGEMQEKREEGEDVNMTELNDQKNMTSSSTLVLTLLQNNVNTIQSNNEYTNTNILSSTSLSSNLSDVDSQNQSERHQQQHPDTAPQSAEQLAGFKLNSNFNITNSNNIDNIKNENDKNNTKNSDNNFIESNNEIKISESYDNCNEYQTENDIKVKTENFT